jgi:cytochrome bd-type quinol oxidase subunit 2
MKLSEFLRLSDGSTIAETYDSPTTLVNLLVSNVFVIAGVVFFFLIIGAGYSYLQNTSKGTEEAKNLAQGAVIGFIVMFAAYWIVQLVKAVTGVDIPI